MSCSRCENGWVEVSDRYVDFYCPWPELPINPTPETGAEYEAAVRRVEGQRAAFHNSVYPCKHCRETGFYRWAGGHYARDHEIGSCEQCQDVHRHRPIDVSAAASQVPAGIDEDWNRTRGDLQ